MADSDALPHQSQRNRRKRPGWRIMQVASIVALAAALFLAVVGIVVVFTQDGIAATLDALLLESIACIVAAVALRVLIEGGDA